MISTISTEGFELERLNSTAFIRNLEGGSNKELEITFCRKNSSDGSDISFTKRERDLAIHVVCGKKRAEKKARAYSLSILWAEA